MAPFSLARMLALGNLTASNNFKISAPDFDQYTMLVDNRRLLQVLRAMEQKHIAYMTSQGRSKGFSSIAYPTMGEEENKELIRNAIETSLFAFMSFPESSRVEFNESEGVQQFYPVTAAKQDVVLRLWYVVFNSTSSCFAESGVRFALRGHFNRVVFWDQFFSSLGTALEDPHCGVFFQEPGGGHFRTPFQVPPRM